MDLKDKDRIKAYFAFRFALAIFILSLGLLIGLIFICYWVIHEVVLERSYQKKYGVGWQAEFERYHGSLSHAHTQIVICVGSLIALVVVLVVSWLFHKRFFSNKNRNHHHVA